MATLILKGGMFINKFRLTLFMELCTSDEVEYSGALVKVEVYTSSDYICNRVKDLILNKSFFRGTEHS